MNDKEKIIFLALGYSNVSISTNLYTDLIGEFHRQGHDVLVVAPAKTSKDSGLKIEGGVKVLRVTTLPLFGVGPIRKGISNLLLPFQYKKALRKHKIKLDFNLILMPTPPITLVNIAEWIKLKSGGKLYLILRDIFPQNAVDLKMMKENGCLHKFFRKQECKLYEIVDSIGCMSKANVDYVKLHNPKIEDKKLHLLPNWENSPNPVDDKSIMSIRQKYDLQNRFVVIFGGTLGRPQKMENIVKLAESCQEIEDMVFFVIGSGTEKKRIELFSINLNNFILKDTVPKDDYYQILAAADVGLISLSDEFTIPNFPSKVLSYFGLKKPVLASLDLQTDFGHMLEETESGFWAEAGNTALLKEKLLVLYNSKEERERLGLNGYIYMKEYLTTNIAYKTICENI